VSWISDRSLARLCHCVLFVLAGLSSEFVAPQPSNLDTMSPKGDRTSMAREQGYVNIRSLQGINSLPSSKITTLQDAEVYVERVADLCGVEGPILRGELLPRLIKAELAAAQDPSQLVSDDRVAEAFNFLSDEFRVPHPQRITGVGVLQYRITMAAIYPHVFSPKNAGGVRPVEALILLHQLVFNGGVPEGAKKYAQKDPQPGSFKISQSRGHLTMGRPSDVELDYRTASLGYFREQSADNLQSTLEKLATILALPQEK
jgi:hypothetical protein